MITRFHRICIKPVVEVVHNEKVCLGGIEESTTGVNQHQFVMQETKRLEPTCGRRGARMTTSKSFRPMTST